MADFPVLNKSNEQLLAIVSDMDKDIEYIENWINNYPRGIFGFKTSAQLFEEEIRKLA